RARLARCHRPKLLLRRFGRPQAVERHLLLVDVRKPGERPGAFPSDLTDEVLDQWSRRRRRHPHHLPARLNPERAIDEEASVLLDAWVYESAHTPFSWTTLLSSSIRPPFRSSLTMSQWIPLVFTPPICGNPVPIAR